jgi:hypothetical protein
MQWPDATSLQCTVCILYRYDKMTAQHICPPSEAPGVSTRSIVCYFLSFTELTAHATNTSNTR